MRRFALFVSYLFLVLISCVDPFDISVFSLKDGLLVVEGFINPDGPTTIQLNHTMSLNEGSPLPELKAQLYVESDDNARYTLTEKGNGLYTIENINLDNAKKYRIRITTLDKKEYVSDFSEVKHTPPIDSVTWKIDEARRGIQFYVYTHDPENAARYYHWEFVETWQYHADVYSSWQYTNGRLVRNPPGQNAYDCWSTMRSTAICITTTDRLRADVVHRFPLVFIPASSEKLEVGYRILVKQYAVTRATYEYLYELRKTSEKQGSIFDANPSQLLGNIRCTTHENEKVLGHISVHGSSEKSKIIFSGGVLPGWFGGRTTYTSCPISNRGFTTSYINQMLDLGLLLPSDDPVNPYQPKFCVDCRERGGTNVKPDYWHL